MFLNYGIPLLCFAIIGFGIFMYVLLDGFVLGMGLLFALFTGKEERDVLMQSVAPIWDANETWLVLGGTALLAAFPMAYSVVLSALYLPLLLMLLALIFRGVAFEFRFKAEKSRYVWDRAFFLGSLVTTFFQGVVLGAYVQGLPVQARQFAGQPWDWLSPFALFTGLALIAGYALLGSTWLIMKTSGDLQARARRLTVPLLLAVLAAIGVISVWMPALSPAVRERWFSYPNWLLLSPAPLFTLVAGVALWRSVVREATYAPFVLAMSLFFLAYAGLIISIWPHIIPPDVSFVEAASPPESQVFLLVGVLFLLPVIIGYSAYSYWVFRGKVTRDVGYHE